MQLIELQVEHFRQYESAVIGFDTGITAIIGANGAGKTTLIEAIAWALYGADAKRGDNSTLNPIWTSGNTRPRVTLIFELGGKRYRVIRTLNSAHFSLYRDGEFHTLATGLGPVTQKSEELLGMNLRQFQTSFCARQKELEFMAYEKERRREEISRMLGYERLSAGIEDAKTDAKALAQQIEGLEAGLGDGNQLRQGIKAAEREIADAEKELEDAQAAEQAAFQALRELEPHKQAAEANRQTYQTLDKQKASLSARQEYLEQQLQQATDQLEEMRKAHARFKDIKPYIDAYQQAKARQKELDDLAPYEQTRIKLQTEKANCRNLIGQVETRLKELALKEERLRTLEPCLQTYNNLQTQLQTLRDNAQRAKLRTQIETTIHEREKQIAQLSEQIEALGDPQAQLRKLDQTCEAARQALLKRKQELSEARDAWNHQKAELNAHLRSLQTEIKRAQSKLEELRALGKKGECPTCKQTLGDTFQRVIQEQEEAAGEKQAQIAKVQSELDALAAEPQEIQTLQAVLTQAEQKVRDLEKQETQLKMQVEQANKWRASTQTLERELESLRTELTSLPHYDPEEEKRINEQIKELQPVVDDANALRVELRAMASLNEELKQYQETIHQIDEKLRALPTGYDAQEHEKVRKLVDDYSEYYDEAIKIKAVLKNKVSVTEQKNQLQAELTKNERELQETLQSIAALNYSEEEYQRLMEAYNGAYAKHADAQAMRTTQENELKYHQDRLKSLQADYERYQEKEKQLREKKAEHILRKTLVDTLQKFRIELNTQLRPTLADYAGEFLSRITDGRYSQMEIDEQYNFTLLDDGARKTVISGGESDVVNLCLRLALARLITERAGLPLSLLILDEVFVSLDSERRQNVLEVLRELRTWFRQILVISHIEDINEAADRCLWIRRDEQSRCSIVRETQEEDEANLQTLIAIEAAEVQGELFANN